MKKYTVITQSEHKGLYSYLIESKDVLTEKMIYNWLNDVSENIRNEVIVFIIEHKDFIEL